MPATGGGRERTKRTLVQWPEKNIFLAGRCCEAANASAASSLSWVPSVGNTAELGGHTGEQVLLGEPARSRMEHEELLISTSQRLSAVSSAMRSAEDITD